MSEGGKGWTPVQGWHRFGGFSFLHSISSFSVFLLLLPCLLFPCLDSLITTFLELSLFLSE